MTDEELIALADKIAPYVPASDTAVMFIRAEYVRAMIAGIRALVAERGK